MRPPTHLQRMLDDVPALLSLPQADSVRVAIAATDRITPNGVPALLPMLLSFTYLHFRFDGFELPGNVCGRREHRTDGK